MAWVLVFIPAMVWSQIKAMRLSHRASDGGIVDSLNTCSRSVCGQGLSFIRQRRERKQMFKTQRNMKTSSMTTITYKVYWVEMGWFPTHTYMYHINRSGPIDPGGWFPPRTENWAGTHRFQQSENGNRASIRWEPPKTSWLDTVRFGSGEFRFFCSAIVPINYSNYRRHIARMLVHTSLFAFTHFT